MPELLVEPIGQVQVHVEDLLKYLITTVLSVELLDGALAAQEVAKIFQAGDGELEACWRGDCRQPVQVGAKLFDSARQVLKTTADFLPLFLSVRAFDKRAAEMAGLEMEALG